MSKGGGPAASRSELDAAARQPMPRGLKPMLAELGRLPADDTGWAYELKWDGIRAVGYLEAGSLHLESRNGNDLTVSFPELAGLGEALGDATLVLDGEIVAFGPDGRPSFQQLQPRVHTTDRLRAARLAETQPVTYVVFDLLYQDGALLVDLPYLERRRRLEALGLEAPPRCALSTRFEGPGGDVFAASKQQGLEGIVAKRLSSPYRVGRRSFEWTKVKNTLMQEVVVGGFTPGQGRRRDQLGSLLLGIREAGGLGYVGQVGTGFSEESLRELRSLLAPLERATSPFAGEVPPRYARAAHWVEPRLVGEVSFSEWTKEGRLRQPSWRGLRDDKSPDEVVRES